MERSARHRAVVFVCTLIVGLCARGQGGIIYVDDDAIVGGDGSSWADAFAHLQDALRAARAGDEIRVAQGIYRPDRGAGVMLGDNEAMFRLVGGATLAGGYAGVTGLDPDACDIGLYETILSGDLNGDDSSDFANIGDNSCYGVVNSLSNDATTVLKGCTISGGWAYSGAGIRCLASDLRMERCTVVRNKTRGTTGHGAGMYSSGGSPVLKDCVFIDNFAWGNGGGFWNEDGDPTFVDCLFEGNTAERQGGGLYSRNGVLMLEGCTFEENHAYDGAGMNVAADGESLCVGCRFIANVAPASGTSSGGGASVDGTGSMTFRDCEFEANSASRGGALSGGGDLLLRRCRFTDNEADKGGGLYCRYGAPYLADCVFEGNVGRGGGGGVHARYGGRGRSVPAPPGATFVRCRFAGNKAYNAPGGGLYNDNTNVTLVNCLFAGNVAGDGGGIFSRDASPTLMHCTLVQNRGDLGGGLSDESGGSVLDHCIVWNNDGDGVAGVALITHSDVEGGWPGAGNIDVDPCFASPGHWEDVGMQRDSRNDVWVDGDYHLKSQAGRWDPESESWVQDDLASPCIDAGDPLAPIGDELFPNGGIVNLGAYGGTIEASKTYFGSPLCETHLAGDINGDCRVNFQDLLGVISQWTDSAPPSAAEGSVIAIIEPKDGDTFTISYEPIVILAEVFDAAVTVTDVQFYIEGDHAGGHSGISLPGHKGTNGWYLVWETVPRRGPSQPEGTYTLTAEATCDDGTSIVSPPVTFTIDRATSQGQR